MTRCWRFLTCFFLSSSLIWAQKPDVKSRPSPPDVTTKATYIKAGRLFDATSDVAKTNIMIVIQNGRIQKVGSAAEVIVPSAADVIDLSDYTVLPGLIDC